jgi:hypothetical protein
MDHHSYSAADFGVRGHYAKHPYGDKYSHRDAGRKRVCSRCQSQPSPYSNTDINATA